MKLKKALSTAAPVVGGAIAAKLVKNLAGNMVSNPKIKAAIPLVAGIVLSESKGKTMQHIGLGMVAVGGADLAGTLVPALAGIEDMDLSGVFDAPIVNGVEGAPVVNGSDYDDNY